MLDRVVCLLRYIAGHDPPCLEIFPNLEFQFFHPQPATAFRAAHERLGTESSVGKTVSLQKIWHLIQVRRCILSHVYSARALSSL